MFFLIGMMGSGKTYFGKKISEIINIPHIDTDETIVKTEGKSVSDIFENLGDNVFRNLEKQTLISICEKYKCAIVSTGGGIILDKDNVETMKKYGKIIFLNRSVEDILKDIDISDRPLIKEDKTRLYEIYNQRIDLYKKYADIEVLSKDRESTLSQLLEYINKGR